jgi:hypothetical protein
MVWLPHLRDISWSKHAANSEIGLKLSLRTILLFHTVSSRDSCAIDAMLLPEVLLRHTDDRQTVLPLSSEGVLCYVWESRYGPILIEVLGEDVFVNGQRVEPHVQ